MKNKFIRKARIITILGLFILLTTIRSFGQPIKDDRKYLRAFVQNFYSWYNKLYENSISGQLGEDFRRGDIYALNKRPELFDLKLRNAIIADYNAQKKVKKEIVGFDSDPFLMAQDVGYSYTVGTVKQISNKFFVDIHSNIKGTQKQKVLKSKVAVIAEVMFSSGRWRFINFLYPSEKDTANLLDILKTLSADRIEGGHKKL